MVELVLAAVHLDDEGHEEDGEDGATETSGLVAVPMRLQVSGGATSGDEKVFIF